MHRNTFFDWFNRVPRRFFDPEDPGDDTGGATGDDLDAGDAGDHPDYVIPGAEGAGDGNAAGGAKPNAKGERQPSDPAAGSEGDSSAAAGGKKPGTTETVPGYRLQEAVQKHNELQARFTAIEEENKRFKRLITGALGIEDPAAAGGAKPLSQREQQLADRIVELVPWLKNLKGLAERADVISGFADAVPEFQRQNEGYWKRVAQQTLSTLEDSVAPLLLGDGKKGSDLSQEQRTYYRAQFFDWVRADKERVQRYESADRTLVDDFRGMLETTVIAPLRRRFGAGAIERDAVRRKLPVGGSGSGPVAGTPNKKPQPLDEDSAADAAWKKLNELAAAGN